MFPKIHKSNLRGLDDGEGAQLEMELNPGVIEEIPERDSARLGYSPRYYYEDLFAETCEQPRLFTANMNDWGISLYQPYNRELLSSQTQSQNNPQIPHTKPTTNALGYLL